MNTLKEPVDSQPTALECWQMIIKQQDDDEYRKLPVNSEEEARVLCEEHIQIQIWADRGTHLLTLLENNIIEWLELDYYL